MATATKLRIVHRTAESRHLDQIESVVQGGGATSDLEAVSASWRRCTAELLINPDDRAAPHIVTDSELRVSREPLGKAIVCAQEEVDRLYTIVRQEGYVVLLCNTDGIAIHHRGDEALAERFKHWGIWVGGVWSERVEGTNGIGTCIAEQRPVLVHRDQHFRTRHTGLSCAGAPIFDPTGKLELVLDTSSMTSNQSHTLALAATKLPRVLWKNAYFATGFAMCGRSRRCHPTTAVQLCSWLSTVTCGSSVLTGSRARLLLWMTKG